MHIDIGLLSAALATPNHLSPGSFWHGHIPFAHFAVAALRPRLVVEFGVEHGDSLFAFADAMRWNGIEGAVVGCDLWEGDRHVGEQSEWIFSRAGSIAATYGGLVELRRESTLDAATRFADGSVDLLHIDASHDYDAVRADFEAMRPRIAPGGLVLFHDIAVFNDRFGVWRLWQELAATFPHLAFAHSCGLGVLAPAGVPASLEHVFAAPDAEKVALARLFAGLGRRVALEHDSAARQAVVGQVASLPVPEAVEQGSLLRTCLAQARW